MIVSLASVMVSRIIFNLRDPRKYSESAATTTAAGSTQISTIFSHTLTNIEEIDDDAFHEFMAHQEGSPSLVMSSNRRRDRLKNPKDGQTGV